MKRVIIGVIIAGMLVSGCSVANVEEPEVVEVVVADNATVEEPESPPIPTAEELLAEAKRQESAKDRSGMYGTFQQLRDNYGEDAPETVEITAMLKAYDANLQEEKRKQSEEAAKAKAESEAKKAAALKSLRAEKDEVTGNSFYYPSVAPKYVDENVAYLYFGADESGRLGPLRLRILYSGERWLFIDNYTIRIDDTTETITPAYNDITRDNHTEVWEYYDMPLTADTLDIVRKIGHSSKTIIRHSGRDRQHDRTLTEKERASMNDMLNAYLEAGGILP